MVVSIDVRVKQRNRVWTTRALLSR